MRAIQIQEFGGPEVLVERDVPEPQAFDGLVVLEVGASGVNYADTHYAENSYLAPAQLPLIPGLEAVGRTPDGRRVVALLGGGGYAERALAAPETTWELPDGVGGGQALALVLQGTTAWHLLRTSAQLRAGETVVVHAAAGGAGARGAALARRGRRRAGHRRGLDRGQADARAAAGRRRGGRRRGGGPDRGAARGQRRGARRRRARDGRRRHVRAEPRGARPLRAPRALRAGRPGGPPEARPRAADGDQPRGARLLARPPPAPSATAARGHGRHARGRGGRRPRAGRRRHLPAGRRAARPRGPTRAAHDRQARARAVAPIPAGPP